MDYLSSYTGQEIDAALNGRIAFVDVTDCFTDNEEKVIDGVKWNEIKAAIDDSYGNGKLLVFKDGDHVFPLYNWAGRIGVYTQITVGDGDEDYSRAIHSSYLLLNDNKTIKYHLESNSGYYGDGTWFRHNKVDFATNDNPMGGHAGWFRLLFDLSPIMYAEMDEGPLPDSFDDSFYRPMINETDGPPPILFLGNNNATGKKFATGVCRWSSHNGGVLIIIPYRKFRNANSFGFGGDIFSEREYRIWIENNGLSSEDRYKREDKVVRLRLNYPDISSSSSSVAIKEWLTAHYSQVNVYWDSAHYVLTEIANGINDGCEILVRSSDDGSSTVWRGKDATIASDSVAVTLSGIYVDGNSVTVRELIISDLYDEEIQGWTFVCQERIGTIPVTDF